MFIDQISADQLKQLLSQEEKPFLLDVRNPFEADICMIQGSVLIPLHDLMQRLEEVPQDKVIVSICHHGHRSMMAAKYLADNGYRNILNLMGGIDAWAEQIDQEMARY